MASRSVKTRTSTGRAVRIGQGRPSAGPAAAEWTTADPGRADVEQTLVFVGGEGQAILDGEKSAVAVDRLVHVPAGTRHTGKVDLRLYTSYAPPEHKPGTIHKPTGDTSGPRERPKSARVRAGRPMRTRWSYIVTAGVAGSFGGQPTVGTPIKNREPSMVIRMPIGPRACCQSSIQGELPV